MSPAHGGRWPPQHGRDEHWPGRCQEPEASVSISPGYRWWGVVTFHLANSLRPIKHQVRAWPELDRDAAACELGPLGSEASRARAGWSPLLPLRPRSHPTLPGMVTAPHPPSLVLPAPVPFAYLEFYTQCFHQGLGARITPGPLLFPVRTPIHTASASGQVSISEQLSQQRPFGGGWIGAEAKGRCEPAGVPVLGGGARECRKHAKQQARPALLPMFL